MHKSTLLTVALAGAFILAGLGPAHAARAEEKFDPYLLDALAILPSGGTVEVIVRTLGEPDAAVAHARTLGADIVWEYEIIDGFAIRAPSLVLDRLAVREDVRDLHLSRATTTLMDISHKAIEADKAWAAGVDGTGVTVAVIDTGIDLLHPFVASAVVSCVSTIGGFESPECTDSDGHGTHVAGTVASRDDVYPGVAPGASLAVVRVLHAAGTGTSADIIAGMDWVAANKDNVNPPIRVATMSIGFMDPGCGDGNDPEAQAADALVDSGVFFSVAAGNAGHNECTIDGASAAAKVTTVAASDDMETVDMSDDRIAGFSSGGNNQIQKPDVTFPGVSITSAYVGAVLIATLDGTSMATPHAAGTAALLLDNDPSMTATQVKDRITGTAVKNSHTGGNWNTVYGHGLGNACLALQLSTCGSGGGNIPPVASFTYSCTDLDCSFDGTGSSDSDGTVDSYSWDFGDGNTATGATASHIYATDGTYTVTLTVTDDGGSSDGDSQAVNVVDTGGSGISLTTNGYKVKGKHVVDLSWSGATGATVDVYRDGSLVTTTANDGAYTDNIGTKGGATFTHKVCLAGTSTCSNTATTVF